MSELISRQAVIDYFVTNVGFNDEDGYPIEDECELRKIWTEIIEGIPPAEPQGIRCRDCMNYRDTRCLVANHHVSEKENCAEVFGAKRRGLIHE